MEEESENIQIRENWAWTKINQLGLLINGDRGKNYPSKKDYVETGIPFINAGHLLNGRILVENMNFISEEKYKSLNSGKLVEGDIIYCLRGTLGKCAIFSGMKAGAIASSLVILRLNKEINHLYIYYFLISPFGKNLIKVYDNGTAQPNLSAQSVSNYSLPFAPLPEQRAIVSKIEQLFSELDNGISNLKLAQEQLKVYRQSVLKKAFEGELTKKWREQQIDLPDAKDLLEQIKKKREEAANTLGRKLKKVIPLTEAEFEELPIMPKGWIWTSINQICFVDVGFAFKSAEFVDEGIRLLRGDNIEPGSLRWENTKCLPKEKIEDYKNLIIKKNEIILAMDRPLISSGLKLAMTKESDVPCLLVQRMARFLPISVDNKYLYYSLQTKDFIHHLLKGQTGTQLPHISETNISSYVFSLPSIAEQKIIVQEIETRLSVCDKIEQDIETNLERSEALRQSILKKAFEGKLLNEKELAEVRGADDWEPAEVLLERIKAEKLENRKKGKQASEKLKHVIFDDRELTQQYTLEVFDQVDK